MLNILILAIFTLMISFIVMLIASFFSKKSLYDREKSSPFECGFSPMTSSRIPFSIRFFLITIIFLIFDVEIALILPTIFIMKNSNLLIWFYSICIFIFILLIGLYHEWNQGALSWTN